MGVTLEERREIELPDFVTEHIDGEPKSAFWATLDGRTCLMVRYVDSKGVGHLKPFAVAEEVR